MNRGAIFLIAKTLNVQSLLLICNVQAYVFKKKLFPKPPSFVGESFKSQIEMFHIIMSPSLGFKRLSEGSFFPCFQEKEIGSLEDRSFGW